MRGKRIAKFVPFGLVIIMTCVFLASCGRVDTGGDHTGSYGANTQKDSSAQTETEGTTGTSEAVQNDEKNGGDFDVSGSLFVWVKWDGDDDGKEEELSFSYKDGGDEFVGFVLVTLEEGERPSAMIDRAQKIVRIFSKEDAGGPYLLVEYSYENTKEARTDGSCIIRLNEGSLVIEES